MPNALAQEKSPYLRQHADNPVDWLPWGEAAFARARAEQKPIFLSIGYSTCHWCHVMAHESFEDAAVAAIINEHFISIKVDREERPDVDKVYMTYVQALTGHGGWPLSAWLTPELKPFFGGTYFPPEDRHGRPGFPAILNAIARGWREEREKLVTESERVIGTLREHAADKAKGEAGEKEATLVEAAGEGFEKGFQYFYEAFDPDHGGFGGAPKFPRASNLAFLFRCAALQRVETDVGKAAVGMATRTLEQMARGGIHDQVGGGFHRYSVDEEWQVPHFEKMLYDQAQIAMNCLEAWQAGGDERHAWLARDIFDYTLRELAAPGGGFYSAEDADSGTADGGHAEGAFYVWTMDELVAALSAEDAQLVARHFGVQPNGNVAAQRDPQGEFTGKNILSTQRPLAETASALGISLQDASDRLGAALEKLRAIRASRPRPHLDDKVITAWNGLMISALARASALPADSLADKREFYRAAAERAAEFVRRELWDEKRGVLFRCWRETRGAAEGFAEDYACMAQGLIDLYEATFDVEWLAWARRLQAKMDALFWDEEHGGWFNSAAGASDIVLRLKEDYDGAEPAPSSVGALNCLRLATLLHDDNLRERGRAALEAFEAVWRKTPQALPQMLCALELALEPPRHVVLVGEEGSAELQLLADAVHAKLGPRRAVIALTDDATQAWFAAKMPWVEAMAPVGGRATAYVCEEYTCKAPITTPAELRRTLSN